MDSLWKKGAEIGNSIKGIGKNFNYANDAKGHYVNFIGNVTQQKQLYGKLLIHLYENKFSYQSINKTCQVIFEIYKNQRQSVVFIFFAFQIIVCYFNKRTANRQQNIQIEKLFQVKIDQLSKVYPPTVNKSVEGAEKIKQYCSENLPDLFSKHNYYNSQTFYNAVYSILADAQSQFEAFEKYAKPLMEQRGHESKFGSKYHGTQTEKDKAFSRILVKCLKSNFDIVHFKQRLQPLWDWNDYLKILPEERNLAIENSIKNKKKIQFKVYDLVRCKSHYKSVEDILYTLNRFAQMAHISGYEILKVDNRLNKGTRDVSVNLKAGKVVAEMQLGLDFDEKGNQFNHKLYEIARGPFGVIMSACEMLEYFHHGTMMATVLAALDKGNVQTMQAWGYVITKFYELLKIIPENNGLFEAGKNFLSIFK